MNKKELKEKLGKLQILWESAKGLNRLFSIWIEAYVCPVCDKPCLDFSSPRLEHPIICRNCHSLFDLKQVKREGLKE